MDKTGHTPLAPISITQNAKATTTIHYFSIEFSELTFLLRAINPQIIKDFVLQYRPSILLVHHNVTKDYVLQSRPSILILHHNVTDMELYTESFKTHQSLYQLSAVIDKNHYQ